jgi:predicted ABC-type ATPase
LPELHIISGSNGAGKSSVGSEYLPQHIRAVCEVFDGDRLALNKTKELYATKLYSYKESKSIANDWIGEYFQERVNKAIEESNHFAYEGHFREQNTWKVIERFKECGYSIHFIFLGLIDVNLSRMRVNERALRGGHNVSYAEIDLNYYGNLAQLDRHFRELNEISIIDTSETSPKVLLKLLNNEVIFHAEYYDIPFWFSENLINITRYLFPHI